MGVLKIQITQLSGFISVLNKTRNGRMHHRRKMEPGKAIFVTANTLKGENAIWGNITGPCQNNAKYRLEFNDLGVVELIVDLNDPQGMYTIESAYSDITFAIKEMMKNPKKPIFDSGRNTIFLKGYYLKSTGKKNVGAKGKHTLMLALSEGHISLAFLEHCIRVGFTMEHYD